MGQMAKEFLVQTRQLALRACGEQLPRMVHPVISFLRNNLRRVTDEAAWRDSPGLWALACLRNTDEQLHDQLVCEELLIPVHLFMKSLWGEMNEPAFVKVSCNFDELLAEFLGDRSLHRFLYVAKQAAGAIVPCDRQSHGDVWLERYASVSEQHASTMSHALTMAADAIPGSKHCGMYRACVRGHACWSCRALWCCSGGVQVRKRVLCAIQLVFRRFSDFWGYAAMLSVCSAGSDAQRRVGWLAGWWLLSCSVRDVCRSDAHAVTVSYRFLLPLAAGLTLTSGT